MRSTAQRIDASKKSPACGRLNARGRSVSARPRGREARGGPSNIVAVAVERATRRFVETVIGAQQQKPPRPLTERLQVRRATDGPFECGGGPCLFAVNFMVLDRFDLFKCAALCAHALRAPRLANFWGSSKRLILRSKGDLARDVLPNMLLLGGDDPSVSTAHRRRVGGLGAPHTRARVRSHAPLTTREPVE